MKEKVQSLKEHTVADLVTVDTLPPGASPIGSRWINLSCAEHRLDSYRDVCSKVCSKVCEADVRSKHPTFGLDWGKALMCSGHNLAISRTSPT